MDNKLTRYLGYESEDNCTLKECISTTLFAIKKQLKCFPFIWIYAKPDQMVGHKFTDDVAICFALTRKRAFNKFNRLYGNCENPNCLNRGISYKGVTILTDY